MRGSLLCLGTLAVLAASATATFGTSQALANDTGGTVIGIRLTYSDMVRIMSYDQAMLATRPRAGCHRRSPSAATSSQVWGSTA